jgi:2-iminoacetate synthase ThiH
MARGQAVARQITVRVRTSRKAAEALRLEIQRLAGRLGIPATAVRIRRVGDERR